VTTALRQVASAFGGTAEEPAPGSGPKSKPHREPPAVPAADAMPAISAGTSAEAAPGLEALLAVVPGLGFVDPGESADPPAAANGQAEVSALAEDDDPA
jgi:hypothetical protein